jgi:FemAB-related protein (PEP-CTERM system-associated)
VGLIGAVAAAEPVTVVTGIDGGRWDRYVVGHPDASVYHLSAWAGVIQRVFGHRTQYFAAMDGKRLVGVLPLVLFNAPLFGRFAVSMPFVNYGGIVADTDDAREALLAAAVAHVQAAGSTYLELRHQQRCCPDLVARTHKVAMVLGLETTVEEQWRVLDRKVRNQVRKAEKAGLQVECGGAELLDAFYGVLARNMRDLGSPVQSRDLFREILTTFPEHARLFCIRLGSTPVAASFVIGHGNRLEVPWASAIRTYNPLCPNVLLYWEMLRFAIEKRFTEFDFGRSTPQEGTYRFKEQWGARPRQLYWEYWLAEGAAIPDRSPKNPRFSAAISLWQRLPVAVTRVVGPLVVRNIP